MSHYWRHPVCALLILVTLALVACSSEPAPYLRLGMNQWTGYMPLNLANDLGYYQDKRIHLVEYSSATRVIRDFSNHAIDAAALTLDEVMLLKQFGQDIYIVLVTDISHGGDVIVAHPALESMNAIKGHRIGSENTALGAYVLSRALELEGLSLNDVTLVTKEANELVNAYTRHEIDAVVTFDPIATRLIKLGAIKIFDSTQIPNEIVDVLVVRKTYFESNPDVVTSLLAGWFKTLAYMDKEPESAFQLMVKRLDMTAAELKLAFEKIHIPSAAENHDLIYSGNTRSVLLKSAADLKKVMLNKKLLLKDIDTTTLIMNDSSYFLKIIDEISNDGS